MGDPFVKRSYDYLIKTGGRAESEVAKDSVTEDSSVFRRRRQPLLRPVGALVAFLFAGYGSYPPYFVHPRERNRLGPDGLGSPFPPLPALHADDVKRSVSGCVVAVRMYETHPSGLNRQIGKLAGAATAAPGERRHQ